MFGFFSKKGETTKTSGATDSQAENIPIHTMARDLESLNLPDKGGVRDFSENTSGSAQKARFNGPSDLQRNSPFLNRPAVSGLPTPPAPKPKLESFAQPVTNTLSKESFEYNPKPTDSDTIIGDAPAKDGTKKLIVILIIILLITATAAGGYYFWSTRKSAPEGNAIVQEIINEDDSGEDEESFEDQPPPIFSATEKNYFMLDLGNSSLESFRGMIGSYHEKITASKISYPVEFTIINTENSPISFQTFVQALNIKFSPEMMSAIEDNFNLYIYDDQGNPGVGLAVRVREGMNPEEILLKEEADLPSEFEPLFPVSQYTIEKNKSFSTSEYDSPRWGRVGIRFQNIISPEDLSVDYSFVNNGEDMLFMGTTKATIRAIIENSKPAITAQ